MLLAAVEQPPADGTSTPAPTKLAALSKVR
jgi:hypothetical protein